MSRNRFACVVATLGPLGYIPWAPGTWGSAVGLGLGWLGAQIAPAWMRWLLLILVGLLGVVVCGNAEQQLGRHDPPSVILDEVLGMALIILALPWLVASWSAALAALLMFRVLDIAKPPPLRWLAKLPGGWGIVADDVGAAAYAVLVFYFISRIAA